MDVSLTFINRSHAQSRTGVVILQKNEAPGMGELPTAWKVIQNCGYGLRHPFLFPADCEISTADSNGNYSPHLRAPPGQRFAVEPTPSGRRLARKGEPAPARDIRVSNLLSRGAITVNLFRGGRLLARETDVAPEQMAVFEVKPILWIGAASDVVEGDAINSAVLSRVNTELSLLGVRSADIVMTGGGPGPDAQPYAFALENVRMA